jgi:hypothetical protein
MGKKNDEETGTPRTASAVRAPLVITILVIALAGGAYYAFYRGQVEYYTGRNLRLISTLTAQIDGRVAMYSGFFREGALKPDAGNPKVDTVREIKRGVKETGRGWMLWLRDDANTETTVPLDDVLRPIFSRRVGAAFDMVLVADDAGNILYSLRTPPPASSLLTDEDEPLDDEEKALSTATAAIIRSNSKDPEALRSALRSTLRSATAMIRSKRAMKERESGSALAITRLGAMSERKGWREYTSLNPASLLVATKEIRVRLGDAEYLLFTQPYTFARKPVSLKAEAQPWIVCGLVAAPRFRHDVSAVSASVVLTAVGVALLALCCWPFLRIALIHPNQELTITDVALIVICTAVGAAVLTLAVLDVFAYRSLATKADAQLEEFSETVVKDFGDNVVRAMKVLERAEAETTPPEGRPKENSLSKLEPGTLAEYPYIDAIAWIDEAGQQRVRFAADTNAPSPSVSQRQYFRDAKDDRTWKVRGQPYVLEWVRSRVTGEVRAVLAKKTSHEHLPVIALSTDLVDVTYALRPPGVDLAILSENGEVVYHSDTERIGYENFFAETDRNRDLRSAVLARRAGIVTASYWGEEKSMYVRPLSGSPWTLVTFRAKRLTRVLNVEAALLTSVLLLLCAAPYVLLYILTLLIAPAYRAPSVWPDESRRGDYLRLCVIYLGLLLLFGLTTVVLMPWPSFYAIIMIPAIAVLSTYLVLHRIASTRRFAVVAALWIAANAILVSVFLRNDVAACRFAGAAGAAKAVLVAVALAVAALTAMLISASSGRRLIHFALARLPLGYSTLYRLCGVLILVLCATLPVAAFFNISQDVQSEMLVKYRQLRVAADLEHRIDRIETILAQSNDPKNPFDNVADILKQLPGSTWELQPPVGNARTHLPGGETCRNPASWTIPPGAASLLPALYEDSIAIRPLFDSGPQDRLWQWCPEKDNILLVRKVRFDSDVSQKLWPATPTPTDQQIVISSPRTPAEKSGAGSDGIDAPTILLCGLGILVVFWYATGFIASRVLLMDVSEPAWMARLPLGPTLGDHLFLVRRDRDAASLTGVAAGKGVPFLDISFHELTRDDRWDEALERLDSSATGQNVRIVDFESGINDGAINLKKLRWLERLLSLPDRTVIVVSTVTPAFVMTTAPPKENPPADYLDRWRSLLDRFVTVTAEELEMRNQEWKRRQEFRTLSQLAMGGPKTWLERETAYNPFLRRLRDELEPDADRPHLLDEIAERAETYYAGLWASCRQDERLLLDQLARNGLANGRNRRTLRRLIARGLVRRDPNLELFSETFRLYVLAAAKREDLVTRARAERGASTWDSLRLPFFFIIISFLLLLFVTQKDMLTTTTALATGLTTGLPIIMKLIGVFTEKRAGAPTGA